MQSVIKHLHRAPRLNNRSSCLCRAGTPTLYSTLGISTTASSQEIKTAYRQLVKQWHPDLYYSDDEEQAGAAERLQTINQAYEVLSDASSRQAYDMQLRILQEAEVAQAVAGQQGVAVDSAVAEALSQAVEKARQALQQAVQARLAAREAYKKAKQSRHDRTRNQKHPKTSPAKPGPSIGAAYQTDSEVQQGSSDTASAQQLPPSAAKEVLDALRAEKQQQRRERRQLRKQATQARAWAQIAEAQAAYQHMQIKAAVSRSVESKDDDDEDELQVFPHELYASPGEWLWSNDVHAAELNVRDPKQPRRKTSTSGKSRSSAADTKVWPGMEES